MFIKSGMLNKENYYDEKNLCVVMKFQKLQTKLLKLKKNSKESSSLSRKQVFLKFQKFLNFQMSTSSKAKKIYMCLALHAQKN